jgi:hypothetical protein
VLEIARSALLGLAASLELADEAYPTSAKLVMRNRHRKFNL